MRSIAKKIKKSKLVAIFCVLSLAFVVGGWAWSYEALNGIHEPLIIHFNNLRGINQVGDVGDLGKLGVFGVIVVMINVMLALELDHRDRFWGKFLASLTLLLAALLFIGFAAIINVN